jgi:cell division cycle 20-like protein 1 (cofactor of APC complex)
MSVTDDFYFNVLDWSSSGVIATAYQNEVKLFTLDIGQYCKYTLSRTCCSLAWHSDGQRLAFGNNAGALAVLDVVKKELVVRRHQHCSRVASLAWIGDSLVSGGADGTIASWDCRTARVDWLRSPNGQNVHRGIVCGLKYNESTGLLASGANDNRVVIWDMRTNTYLMQGMHRAAVKALAWSPHRRNTLMTGAGTFDKRIRIWDLAGDKMNCLREHNTGSQVCNAIWSPVTGEILTSHGYTTNHLALWRWSPDSHQLYARATMAGHTDRVLHMAGSPVDTRLVVSAGGAGDSMMHFWKVFERQKEPTASPSLLDLPTMR